MIPTKPPPTFKNPEKWSTEMQDFVSKCLVKKPEERMSATQLLRVCLSSSIWNTVFILGRKSRVKWAKIISIIMHVSSR